MDAIAETSPLYPLVLEIRALQERVAKLEAERATPPAAAEEAPAAAG